MSDNSALRRRSADTGVRRAMGSLALLGAMACGSAESPDAAGRQGPSQEPIPTSVRFVLDVSADHAGPVFAVLANEAGQPGWITVFNESGRVFLSPRCEIEDCGGSGGVCGASIPVIEAVSARESRLVEFEWDKTASDIDSERRCERRTPAPPGEYRARFCFGTGVDEGSGPAVPPSLTAQRCEERTFTLAEREVRLTI